MLATVIWTVVAVGFVFTFFSSGGAATLAQDKARRVTAAVFLGAGFLAVPLVIFLTRARPRSGRVARDERDEKIARRADLAGLYIVAIYVFVFSLSLWEAYSKSACVPAGWMWFLAYSSMILTNLAVPCAALILDFGMFDRAEG